MAIATATATNMSINDARKILEKASAGNAASQKAHADLESARKSMQATAESQRATEELCSKAQSNLSSFESQWLEFKAKFDNLSKLAVERLSGMMGTGGQDGGRPAELISVDRLAQTLHKSKKVVVLTGAGISAESGIPTFRGSDGYWTVGSENYQPQELATWKKFNEMPEELWKWYQYRWGVCRQSKPNPGHHALVELDGIRKDGIMLVTQNIDGLHLDAGTNPARLCEIHGRIDEMRCDNELEGSCLHGVNLNYQDNWELARSTVHQTPKPSADEEKERLPHCSKCGCRQRPKILWFDECYNEAFYKNETALRHTEQCDLLLIIGTQLTTGLPRRMVREAKEAGAIIVKMDPLIDLEDPISAGMLHLQGKSGEVLPQVLNRLRILQKEQLPAPLADLSETGAAKIVADTAPVPSKALTSALAKLNQKPAQGKTAPVKVAKKKSVRSLTSPVLEAAGAISLETAPKVNKTAAGGGASAINLLKQKQKQPSSTKPASLSKDLVKHSFPLKSQPVGFFVYGTLRPDNDTQATWTKPFNQGLSGELATLSGASMYHEGSFPSVCLEKTRCSVRGYLLTPEDKTQFDQIMSSKLAEADCIEGYPSLYDRAVVTVVTMSGESKQAYVYHRNGRIDRLQCRCIADGDWLSRKRLSDSEMSAVASKTGLASVPE
eukprot:TRINITY_DN10318_c0_g1_i1.p1 TRINITY_DN10318_c0_g1~~TRINITY_DN10318_c0_g1_i1.p1  ORF type:complete len:668 (-),score=138.27 TRINITY_DN10318_c0_g1_i1:292-2295(-)